MAQMIDFGGDAGSNLVSGVGSNSAVFQMPATVGLKVESVLATVNNAAGGNTTAKITIKDSSGVVIATNTQSEVIPAGDTGTATFALRLTARDPNAGLTGIYYDITNNGTDLTVFASDDIIFFADSDTFVSAGASVNIGSFNAGSQVAISAQGAGNNGVILTTLNGGPVNIAPSGEILLRVAGGNRVEVIDHLDNPIFRIDEDGDLHGLTGKTLTFDL